MINHKAQNQVKASENWLESYQRLKDKSEDAAIRDARFGNLSGDAKLAILQKADEQARAEYKSGLDSIKNIGQRIDFSRTGLMIDLAGGLAYSFINQANGTLYNSGAWVTGGYSSGSGLTTLAIVRFLYDPGQNSAAITNAGFADYHTLDYGARLLYDSNDGKFTFGGELIYRNVFANAAVKSSWRYSVNTDYQVGKNQVLSFSFGRDFDGTINKGGSLIAALNLILGFGNNRPVK